MYQKIPRVEYLSQPGRKINWTPAMLKFLKDNYSSMTNLELADALKLKITAVRMKLYEIGYKRMEMEYWTKRQVNFLTKNYHTIGDLELAEIFQARWPKNKLWTKKHIDKKRKYLRLHRTEKELLAIKQRNKKAGRWALCAIKRWLKTGQAAEGEVRMWEIHGGRKVPFIKVNGSFMHWARHTWIKTYGPLPKGMNVIFKDNNPVNQTIDNLMLVTNAELAKRNSDVASAGLSFNYIAGILSHKDPDFRKFIKQFPDVIEAKRAQLQLNRKINSYEK